MKATAHSELLRVLPADNAADWLAIHEAKRLIPNYSENCLATRASELARQGLIVGRTRPGRRFREWARRA